MNSRVYKISIEKIKKELKETYKNCSVSMTHEMEKTKKELKVEKWKYILLKTGKN